METIQLYPAAIGWLVTVGLFVVGYVIAFIRQNGKNEALYEETRKEIERLTKSDSDIMRKLDEFVDNMTKSTEEWRVSMREREAYNERNYVRKEVCELNHKQIIEQLAKLSSANIDVRLAKIETSQQQILVAIEDLKRDTTKNK